MQRLVQLIAGMLLGFSTAAGATELTDLGEQFWRWRAETQPITTDDIPRLVRPPGWVPDWSAADVQRQRTALAGFERRWKALRPETDVATESMPVQPRHLAPQRIAPARHWSRSATGWRSAFPACRSRPPSAAGPTSASCERSPSSPSLPNSWWRWDARSWPEH